MNEIEQKVYKEALKSQMRKKYGVIMVHRGKVISQGHNKYCYISNGIMDNHYVL